MIRPLRNRHRVTISLLALAIPALFAAGILARRAVPLADDRLIRGVALGAVESTTTVSLDGRLSIVVRRQFNAAGEPGVVFEPSGLEGYPELLVYRAPGSTNSPTSLPPGSRLLGALVAPESEWFPLASSTTPPTTPSAGDDPGQWIVYAWSTGEVIGSLTLDPPADRR